MAARPVALAVALVAATALSTACADTQAPAESEPIAKPLRQYVQIVNDEAARIADVAKNRQK